MALIFLREIVMRAKKLILWCINNYIQHNPPILGAIFYIFPYILALNFT